MTSKKPLQPEEFPLVVDGRQIKGRAGNTIATAESEAEAVEIVRRLNEGESNNQEDRWSA